METKRAKATKAGGAQKESGKTRARTVPVRSATTAPLDTTSRDPEGRTPLHLAAFYGYSSTVSRLLAQNADINARDNSQRTPGHWSAYKGHMEVMKLLMESGADLNARDTEGRTLLRMAVIGRQIAIQEMLRGHGAIL